MEGGELNLYKSFFTASHNNSILPYLFHSLTKSISVDWQFFPWGIVYCFVGFMMGILVANYYHTVPFLINYGRAIEKRKEVALIPIIANEMEEGSFRSLRKV